jgi:hypothetical protein
MPEINLMLICAFFSTKHVVLKTYEDLHILYILVTGHYCTFSDIDRKSFLSIKLVSTIFKKTKEMFGIID